jgi:hypothetical protein
VRLVREEHRGVVGAGRLAERIDRFREQLVQCRRTADRSRDAVQGIDFGDPPPQLFPLGDVAGRCDDVRDFAARARDRCAARLDPEPRAVFRAQAHGQSLHGPAGDHVADRAGPIAAVVGVDELEHRSARELVGVPAERPPRGRPVHDRPAGVDDRDELARSLENQVLERSE